MAFATILVWITFTILFNIVASKMMNAAKTFDEIDSAAVLGFTSWILAFIPTAVIMFCIHLVLTAFGISPQ